MKDTTPLITTCYLVLASLIFISYILLQKQIADNHQELLEQVAYERSTSG